MQRFVLLLVVALAGCGILPETVDETQTWSAQRLYSEAKSELNDGNYEQAVKYYEMLEARFPYGRYAQQAQLDTAFAYYRQAEPASAVAAADRFLKLHPNSPHADYAYYLKGLANFNEDLGLLGRVADQDLSERDPKAARESFESFQELVKRFPQSKYAEDSRARMRYLVNALARHELHVMRYYMRRGALVAAVNRGKYTVEHYPQAPATKTALALMVKCYDDLGMPELRDDTLRVLKLNYPDGVEASSLQDEQPWYSLW